MLCLYSMNAAEPGQEFQGSPCCFLFLIAFFLYTAWMRRNLVKSFKDRCVEQLCMLVNALYHRYQRQSYTYTHTHTQCKCNGQLLERRQICVLLCYTSLHIGRQSATDVYMCVRMNMCASLLHITLALVYSREDTHSYGRQYASLLHITLALVAGFL
jgi:hypothetical protein